MNIRVATRADNEALCALEARTPLVIDGEPYFIRSSSFFDKHDLQERSVVMVAEKDGEAVGVCAGALNQAPLAGQERLLLYIHHERIAPEHQRQGIGGALTQAISAYWKEQAGANIDSSYWYIGAGNQQSRNFAARGGSVPWPVSGWMVIFDTDSGAPAQARPIGAGPIFDIVRLINRTHAGRELFSPYEQVDFGRRLSRSMAYGWGDVYGTLDGGRLRAAAGLWGENIADWGYEHGDESAMAKLVESLLGVARERGHTSLTMFLDPSSSLYPHLAHLPQTRLEMLFYAPRIETPAAPAPLYVDPVYF